MSSIIKSSAARLFSTSAPLDKKLLFLTAKQVYELYCHHIWKQNVGKLPFVDKARLDSALHSPKSHMHWGKVKDPIFLAAQLAYSIIHNHPFNDGNKRVACIAANSFLKAKQICIQRQTLGADANNERLIVAHNQVACSNFSVEELAELYSDIAAPFPELDWSEQAQAIAAGMEE